MLKTRLITASLLIAVLLAALFYGSNMVWGILSGCFILFGFWEWGRIIKLRNRAQQGLMIAALAMSLFLIHAFNTTYVQFNENMVLSLMALSGLIWLVMVPFLLSTHSPLTQNKIFMTIIGFILLSATLISFLGLHRISPWLLLGVIATVSIADSAAYFAGKNFGKHKLAPSISPGKTWEGVVGALIAITIFGLLLRHFLHYSAWLLAGLWFITIVSIMGDLFESKLKRQAHLKDSGHILPGHGGVLDRIDGLMPAATLTLFYIYLPLMISPKFKF